jgi:hypothetical protein
MMRYPANRVIAALQMYEALPHNPTLVDALLLPALKVELEAHFSRVFLGRDPYPLHMFAESLRRQYCDCQNAHVLHIPQNLQVHIPGTLKEPMTISWHLLYSPGAPPRVVQVNLGYQSERDAEARLMREQGRIAAIQTFAFALNVKEHT